MPDDNEPIGLIMTTHKDDILVEYALGSIANSIFVSKYQLYLPDREWLEKKIRQILQREFIGQASDESKVTDS